MNDGILLWWDLFKVLLLLAGMILLARSAPAIMGRLSGNMPVKRQRRMHLIDSLYLGTDKSVHLVEIDGQQLVLGASRTGVNLLTQMPAPEASAAVPMADGDVSADITWQSAAHAAGLNLQGAAHAAGRNLHSAKRSAGVALQSTSQTASRVFYQVTAASRQLWQKGCAFGVQTYRVVMQTWHAKQTSNQLSNYVAKAPVQRRKAGKRAVKTSRRSM